MEGITEMNNQVKIDQNLSNPMLLGVMELIKEDSQELQKRQVELKEAMDGNAEIAQLMEEHKNETAQLQADQQKNVTEKMKESQKIAELIEAQKKEIEELRANHRKAIEKAMGEDPEIVELVKQQNQELGRLHIQQQLAMNQKVNNLPEIADYVNNVKNARQGLQERQKMFEREMLKAVYLAPVAIKPEPEADEDGNLKLLPGSTMTLQMLPIKDKGMLMAFTDSKEFAKWNNENAKHTISMTMQDFFAAIANDTKLAGVTINPFSANIIIPRERIEMMLKAAVNQKKKMSKNVEVVEANVNE